MITISTVCPEINFHCHISRCEPQPCNRLQLLMSLQRKFWTDLVESVDSASKFKTYIWSPHVSPGRNYHYLHLESVCSVTIPTFRSSKNNWIQSHLAFLILGLLYSKTHELGYSAVTGVRISDQCMNLYHYGKVVRK